ncbi:hypothetical protein FQN49_005000 [Arthroderma sp. PD_2]|nr:hypothetical protein FQN49_005000 [Arthroderma sp. PD_2]
MSLPSPGETPIFFLKTESIPRDGYAEYFSPSKGYKPCFIPVFEHKFNRNNLQKVRDLVLSGELVKRYGGVIFTSQRAVEGFSKMIQDEVGIEKHTIGLSRSLSFYSVGPATHRSLKSLCDSYFPHSDVIGENAGTGEKLSGLILSHYNDRQSQVPVGGETQKQEKLPLLFLVGEQHRDIIPKTLMSPSLSERERIEIDTLVVYETGVMQSFGKDFVAVLEKEDQASARMSGEDRNETIQGPMLRKPLIWIVVFSPSGCEVMLQHLGLLDKCQLEQTDLHLSSNESGKPIGPPGRKKQSNRWVNFDYRIATIGPTTRDHLISNFGVQPDVCAETPSPEGLGEGIQPIIDEWRKPH